MTATPTTEFTGLSFFEAPVRRPIAVAALGLFAAIAPQVIAPSFSVSNDQAETQVTRVVIYDDVAMVPAGSIPSPVTPQGWPFAWPDLLTRKFPPALQKSEGYLAEGALPSPVTPQGWPAIFPERFARPFPVSEQRFDVFQPLGVSPSYSASNDQAETEAVRLVVYQTDAMVPLGTPPAPQGWPAVFPDRFAAKFPAPEQLVSGDSWIGNVPTIFVGNAWIVSWDGPARKLFPGAMQMTEFMQWRQGPRSITAAPDLIGSKAVPSLIGSKAVPTLLGVAAAVNLSGKVGT